MIISHPLFNLLNNRIPSIEATSNNSITLSFQLSEKIYTIL
jgi:hypothetical protein